MRKFLALALAIVMVFSMTIMASAENTTVLTTTVPDAKFTLNIPTDQNIEYGTVKSDIGKITVTEASGFAVGKNLQVTMTWGDFTSNSVTTTIPYHICGSRNGTESVFKSGDSFIYLGYADGTVTEKPVTKSNSNKETIENFSIWIKSENWGKALGGTYTSTITFTAEVVVEE